MVKKQILLDMLLNLKIPHFTCQMVQKFVANQTEANKYSSILLKEVMKNQLQPLGDENGKRYNRKTHLKVGFLVPY